MPDIRHAADSPEALTPERCYIQEIANTPDDPDVSIARARVTPGTVTAWHVLDDVTERYVIIAGEGAVELGGTPTRTVGPGDVVHIAAGVRQRIRNTGDVDLVFYCVCSPRFVPACYRALE